MRLRRSFTLLVVAAAALTACGEDEATTQNLDQELARVRVEVVSAESMEVAEEAVRLRLDAIGVDAAPLTHSGSELHLHVPEDKEALVRDAIAATSRLVFRPVLAPIGSIPTGEAREDAQRRVAELRSELAIPDGVTAQEIYDDAIAGGPEPNRWGIDLDVEEFGELFGLENQLSAELTAPGRIEDTAEVVLATEDGAVYRLAPVALYGSAVESARAEMQGTQWAVNLVLRAAPDGIGAFNEVAASCFAGGAACPAVGAEQGQLAIVVDGVILSAPTIQQPSFERDQISISGTFDERSAKLLAASLSALSKPVEVRVVD